LKLLLATTESRNARAKQKYEGILIRTIQPRGKFFASFLLVQERWSLSLSGLAKLKELKIFLMSFWIPVFTGMTERETGMNGEKSVIPLSHSVIPAQAGIQASEAKQ
jgi:hypothetical protein